MTYLFDSQEDAPALAPIELFGDEVKHCFLSLRAFWLAGDDMALEVKHG